MAWHHIVLVVLAALFALSLLLRYRPRLGRRRQAVPDPGIAEARARARGAKSPVERAQAFVLVAQRTGKRASGITAATGFYLRALKADPTSCDAIAGLCSLLERRRPEMLEALLWRRLATVPWQGETLPVARAVAEGLARLYAGPLRGRDRALVLGRLAGKL
jgi:hypothetical protein